LRSRSLISHANEVVPTKQGIFVQFPACSRTSVYFIALDRIRKGGKTEGRKKSVGYLSRGPEVATTPIGDKAGDWWDMFPIL